jgi:plastocyanin domain-containing protein
MKNEMIAVLALAMGLGGGISAHAKEGKKINVDLAVTENGFEPKLIDVKPGSDVVLKITRKTDATCATQIHVPSKRIKAELPFNKTVTVALGKLENGEIRFACGMNMIEGKILVK